MFALTKTMSYYLSPGSIDMRKGIYSLYQIVKSELKRNPLSGEVFIFLGKNRRCIKILLWEKDGFLLYHKKLEKGTYEIPLNTTHRGDCGIEWRTFVLMLEGVGMRSAKFRKRFGTGLK
ncbi:MAG: IS66 family insertion sequence element accessory protein TnpB [Oscillospiraceae bacterium]|nr:IS66 family insertion sequence element accessory protein TnpB [Oscillospiraceae bacterium]